MLTNIPKVMNFYWDMSNMSFLHYLTIISFKKYNQDWKIIVNEPMSNSNEITWLTHEQKIKYIGKNYYPELKKLKYVTFNKIDFNKIGFYEDAPEVYKSDYLRWYVLSTNGGGWSDFDIIYLTSIEKIKYKKNIDTVLCHNIIYGHIIGFYLSKPNNEFFKNILKNCNSSLDLTQYQSIGSCLLNKLYPSFDSIINTHKNINFLNIPMNFFYTINHLNLDLLFNSVNINIINEEIIGVHWYNGSDEAKKFLNEYDYFLNNYKNTITKLINIIL